ASRSLVMAGGATHRASLRISEQIKQIAAGVWECPVSDISLGEGQVSSDHGVLTLKEIADIAYFRVERLPNTVEPCLEVTERYRPEVETGAFSYSTHAVVVEVDVDTGHVQLLDYSVAEDCGKIVNPMIVDGQITGGVAQGIGTALYEEI